MTRTSTSLNELILFEREIFRDHRGTFVETFNIEEFRKTGLKINFVRDCISTSKKKVLRGIHYDDKTWKLIQCMHGEIFFVVVDMRENSSQFLKWQSFILSDKNRHQVLVPPNFGNGHLVLSESCIFHYKMSEYYDPQNEKTLKWDDPRADISWPVKDPILSVRDRDAAYL